MDSVILGKKAIDWVCQGARDEDRPSARATSHFYDPLREVGITDTSLFRRILSYPDSRTWAWQGSERDVYLGGMWHFKQLRGLQRLALTSPDRVDRERFWSKYYQAIGHFLHLIQDLGQPQHTRNDAHAPFPLGDEAPYEAYCATNYGTNAALWNLALEPTPSFGGSLLPPNLPTGMPSELASIWDTDQYRFDNAQTLTQWSGSPGLAEYSNRMFVTDNTMFTREDSVEWLINGQQTVFPLAPRPEPFHVYPQPRLQDSNLGILGLLSGSMPIQRLGETDLFLSPLSCSTPLGTTPEIAGAVVSNGTCYLGLNDINFASMAEDLLPKCLSYGRYFANYVGRECFEDSLAYLDRQQNPDGSYRHWVRLYVRNTIGEDILNSQIHMRVVDETDQSKSIPVNITSITADGQVFNGAWRQGQMLAVNFNFNMNLDGDHMTCVPFGAAIGTVGNEIGTATVPINPHYSHLHW